MDRWGVPHMYASTLYDAFFVQGFNAARDRLWQIDLWRRRGLGELAAVFGPVYVEKDRAARLFLYRGDMYREWLAYGSDSKRIAEAFVAGVNAFVGEAKKNPSLMPMEFNLLGYEPALWKPEDIVRLRSHGLTRNLASEVARAQVACRIGLSADEIRRGLEPAWESQVPSGLDICSIPEKVLDVYALATQGVTFDKGRLTEARLGGEDYDFGLADVERVGSNNWAIAPSKSATGRPILANDPHRDHSVPSLRYIAHVSAPGLNVIGAGEPALPGISIGHNERIAFGLTIFGIDQEDLYAYETNPEDPNEYRYADRWEPMRLVSEEILVRNQSPKAVGLKFTRHGPVIYEDRDRNKAYAVRAAWLEPGMAPYFESVEYMRAQNWDEFLAAMNRWGSPSENQVYADTQGNIGWVPAGLTPIRNGWDGLLPVPGDGRYEWQGFLDRDQLPSEFNPPRQWVGSANQMNLPAGFPYEERKIGFEWADQSRWLRITEVLSVRSKVSLEDSTELQTDYLSLPARRVTALLKKVRATDPPLAKAIELLTAWDCILDENSAAGALFEVWFTKQLRQGVINRFIPKEGQPLIGAGDTRVILDLLEEPDERFGSSPEVARDELLLASLKAAVEDTEELLGQDWKQWQWGKLHHAQFEHPLAEFMDQPTRAQANIGPFPMGGNGSTVGAASYRPGDFRLTGGASFRMVLDVGKWDSSWAINTPGQSGDISSPHYRDLTMQWLSGKYFPLLYNRREIEKATELRIALHPAP